MIGIVAEYNPFHDGHKYHIDNSTDGCVCVVMSGDFVQRGEPAIFDKFSRAAQACRNGADLVVELPLPWCLSSAETFAYGAVKILEQIGCDAISFGSECGDIELLRKASKYDCSEVVDYMRLHPEVNYPKARRIVTGMDVFDYPNNSLGVEYLKAADIPCFTIKRSTEHDGHLSAKDIREQMISMGLGFNYKLFDVAAVSRLRMLSLEKFNMLPDSENGVGDRLYKAVQKCNCLDDIYDFTKTKSITMSAVRRLVMCAVLGIDNNMNKGVPPYIRVLAFNEKGRDVLKKMSIPFITQPKQVYKFGDFAQKVFAVGASAHDLYNLILGNKGPQECGTDYRKGPYIVQSV